MLIVGILIPLVCIFLLHTFRVISDIGLENRKDRFLPFILTAASYIFCSILFFRLGMPLFVPSMLIGAAISLIINAVISLWWKISAHLTGAGGLLGGILCVSYKLSIDPFDWIMLIVMICGLLAAARLYLKAHTPAQVVGGFFNGFFWTLFVPGFSLAPFYLLFR
jgi:membrane-associated phospholipid phosphatase